MAEVKRLKHENQGLKLALREANLRAAAIEGRLERQQYEAAGFARGILNELDLDSAINSYKFSRETYIGRVVGSRAAPAITVGLEGDEDTDVVTLQDMAFVPRARVAAIKGVGSKAMDAIDAAMTEHGLEWGEPEPEEVAA